MPPVSRESLLPLVAIRLPGVLHIWRTAGLEKLLYQAMDVVH